MAEKHTHEFLMDAACGIQFSACMICGLPYATFIRAVVEARTSDPIAAKEVQELENLFALESHD